MNGCLDRIHPARFSLYARSALVCSDILEENVFQPILVSTSAIALSTETVRMILKIDDIVATR